MFGHTFYHGTIRRYVILFGTLFNELYINRPDTTHNRTQTIKVPIAYGPREKVLARLTADPDLNKQPAIVLPRMSFEINNTTYASERKLTTTTRNVAINSDNPDQLKYGYAPVPYDFGFELSIYVKNADDGTRILEQILPFFTPEWTPSVNIIPELNIVQDIPVVLNSVRSEDLYEGDFETRRVLTWTLDFTLKGYLYGPTRKGEIIKLANTNFYDTSIFDEIDDAVSNTDVIANFTIVPGLTDGGGAVAGNPSTATGTAVLSGDGVDYVTITSKGYNYSTANVVFTAPPTAQTATATSTISSNVVVGLGITAFGRAYTTAPTITIAAPSIEPLRATATATVANSIITDISVTNGGTLYTSNATATVVATVAVGEGTAVSSLESVATVVNGVVTAVNIPAFDSELDIISADVVLSDPTGTANNFAATASSNVVGGQVTGLTIVYGGNFYSEAPTVTIDDPPAAVTTTGTVTVTANVVQEVVITNAGTGYVTAPTLTISDPVQSANSSSIQGNTSYGYIITRS